MLLDPLHKKHMIPNLTPPLWDSVKKLYSDFDISNFRAIGGVNDRLGIWGAFDKSSRYYKSLMFEFAMHLDNLMTQEHKNYDLEMLLERIPNQNIGSPPTIKLGGGKKVSLDYLLAIEEYFFCSDILNNIENVCEIGAGFGRTCHTFLSLGNIAQYTIIDLPEVLALSKAYLSKALSKKDYLKIKFISAENYSSVNNVGLVINIDSLQEMPLQVGKTYLDFISENSISFFSKNAMGKYSPFDIDLEIKNVDEFSSAMKMGLISDVFPLFDIEGRKRAVKTYHQMYCPNGFELKKTQRGFGQYLSYELSLFSKKT